MTVVISISFSYASTITYTYDPQHRLVQANYGPTQRAFYNYDAAGNISQHLVITDAKYLKSFLWYLSWSPCSFPMHQSCISISWPEIWAIIASKSNG